jgi:ankyrin repeat protein
MLLEHDNIAVNQATTADGATPLFAASNHGFTEVVKLLLA